MLTPRGSIMQHFTVAHANVNTECMSKGASGMASEEPIYVFTAVIQVNICTNQL